MCFQIGISKEMQPEKVASLLMFISMAFSKEFSFTIFVKNIKERYNISIYIYKIKIVCYYIIGGGALKALWNC